MEAKLSKGYLEWSAKDVASKLIEMGCLPEAAKKLEEHRICGNVLNMLTEDMLKKIGISLYGDILEILKFTRQIEAVSQMDLKIFNDPINGHTSMHPLCIKIIDTPQFQRMRYLKQGGACYFVFPGAANNRFEHSLGVCHLAGELARTLQVRQPELKISETDILCVQIAGLCHDLGHGPFSHLFDNKFLPTVRPNIKWKHENGSVMMFEYLIKQWQLEKEFEKYGLSEKGYNDITFISELITSSLDIIGKEWPYSGRDKKKAFLYEIVSNNRSGIDVDKWDYFARDCQLLGLRNTFDHQRFMKFVRVLNVYPDDILQICFKDKEAETLYGMYSIRASLQRKAYKHRVVNAIEFMITDAFVSADKKAIIPGKNGKPRRLSECIDDPEAYTKLNDSIFHMILVSTDDALDEARQILQRIERRQLYRCVGETCTVSSEVEMKKEDIPKIKNEILCYIQKKPGNMLKETDIEVDLVVIDYGHNTDDPFKSIRFYNKNDVSKADRLDINRVSLMMPSVFSEKFVRLYCKTLDAKCLEVATVSFREWCFGHKPRLQLQQLGVGDDNQPETGDGRDNQERIGEPNKKKRGDSNKEQSGGSRIPPKISGSHQKGNSLIKSDAHVEGHKPIGRLRPKKRRLEDSYKEQAGGSRIPPKISGSNQKGNSLIKSDANVGGNKPKGRRKPKRKKLGDSNKEQSGGSRIPPKISGSHQKGNSLIKSDANVGGNKPKGRRKPKRRKLGDSNKEQSGGSMIPPKISGSHQKRNSLIKSDANVGGYKPIGRLSPKKRKLEDSYKEHFGGSRIPPKISGSHQKGNSLIKSDANVGGNKPKGRRKPKRRKLGIVFCNKVTEEHHR